ncbi:MAG: hypothetical protein GXP62_01965 [Oligoflexia bacterium]|nr:hypothetical protein [Oligoflexia bacterium]
MATRCMPGKTSCAGGIASSYVQGLMCVGVADHRRVLRKASAAGAS